jgi:hypothetical protein
MKICACAPGTTNTSRAADIGGAEGSGGASQRRIAQVLGDHGVGERDDRDRHQAQDVQDEEGVIDPPQQEEEAMVVDPIGADDEEGDGVGDVGRPLVDERIDQIGGLGRIHDRHRDLEDEKGDGDGEDSVDQRFQSPGGKLMGRRSLRYS